ncbi:PMVK (predicted) [Pycnogonum litorale]
MECSYVPNIILICSGKRKSGKDYVCEVISKRIGIKNCSLIHLSAPLKSQYAKEHNLDYGKLLDSSSYKELYRSSMIQWGEEMRRKDPSYFCRHAIETVASNRKQVWIICDARRHSDLDYFYTNHSNITATVRVVASEPTRTKRNWKFTAGVDDAESECNLDDVNDWDFVIVNDGDENEIEVSILKVVDYVCKVITS